MSTEKDRVKKLVESLKKSQSQTATTIKQQIVVREAASQAGRQARSEKG